MAAYLRSVDAAADAQVRRRLDDPDLPVAQRPLVLFDLLAEAARTPDWRGCPFINAAAEYSAAALVGSRRRS